MFENNKYYVRIDYKVEGMKVEESDFQAHIEYLREVSANRKFRGGGFNNAPGGMIIFEALNFDDAQKIANDDPLIKKNLFRYELYEWEILLSSTI